MLYNDGHCFKLLRRMYSFFFVFEILLLFIQSPQEKHTGELNSIRDRYLDLSGRMSDKFYDETRFFSKQLLLIRTDNADIIQV